MNHFKRKLQAGMSLIELMIAMVLSLVVAAAIIVLFSNSKETYILSENMARLQENGRFATYLLSQDLRWTDYRACTLNIVPLLPNAINGDDDVSDNYGTDTVNIIRQMDECPDPGTFVLPTPPTTLATEYSIQEGASGRPSLFRSVGGGAPVEMVEDISNLQILYGEDTDGDDIPNYHVDIDDVTNLEQVVSVQFTLTAQTPKVQQSTGGDVLTRDFTSTIVLRNRIP